jgi:hypothetical protein
MKIGDRVTFLSYAVPPRSPARRVSGIVEYQDDDNPNNFVILTDSGVRHSVPLGWLEHEEAKT